MAQDFCPVCQSQKMQFLFSLPPVPIHINVMAQSLQQAQAAPTGVVELVRCPNCGFVFNRKFEPGKMAYGQTYHAQRGHSQVVQRHFQDVLDLIEEIKPIGGLRVLEVACGSGEFLDAVMTRSPELCTGVDPSVKRRDGRGVRFYRTFFNEEFLAGLLVKPDLLINRHMLEHVTDPLSTLRLLADALADDGLFYLEMPRLDWILENGTFYDFLYEHCAYFSDNFLLRLLTAAGFEVARLTHSFSGQNFSVCARRSGSGGGTMAPARAAESQRLDAAFAEMQQTYQAARNRFLQLQEQVCLWGGAGKGSMWANLLDPARHMVFVDIDPYRQHRYILGSGHRVIAPRELAACPVQTVVVLNDVYLQEVSQLLSALLPDRTFRLLTASQLLQSKPEQNV